LTIIGDKIRRFQIPFVPAASLVPVDRLKFVKIPAPGGLRLRVFDLTRNTRRPFGNKRMSPPKIASGLMPDVSVKGAAALLLMCFASVFRLALSW
jgi:hypothetical protein